MGHQGLAVFSQPSLHVGQTHCHQRQIIRHCRKSLVCRSVSIYNCISHSHSESHVHTGKRSALSSPASLRSGRDRHRSSYQIACTSQGVSIQDKEAESVSGWELLKAFTRKDFKNEAQEFINTPAKRDQIRSAVMAVYSHPSPPAGWTASPEAEVLLGVTASSIQVAARAYRDWCSQLGLPYIIPTSRVDGVLVAKNITGSVYLKYNCRTSLCYVSSYAGGDRGVLIQLGGEQLGHFPLGLWDEGMTHPPAPLS